MSEKLQELKKKLTEIFQLDQTDLDFGIYRIMNQKAEEITDFLDKKLLPQVKESFAEFQDEGQAKIKADLNKLIETLKNAGMNPDDSPKVQELKNQLSNIVDMVALENEVFSHLTNFFSRYYQGGDFLSLRRYKKDVYAIPYEGEEVKLYWANADQYYIKSSENFKDYSFKLPDNKTVHFKLVEAETEKDNNKAQNGKERRFLLCSEESLFVENGELFIRFNYIADESKTSQQKHNEQAIEKIKSALSKGEFVQYAKLLDPKPTDKNKSRTILEKHLTDYTAKNSFDYFIHKDLGGFLRRELDFYIKNEVIFLDDLDDRNIKHALNKTKAMKKIAHKIIDFLEQLENFQKKLWLKKKFVVECEYCLTLDKTPKELYLEIISNKIQIEEWKKLFAIEEIKPSTISVGYSEPLTIDFLKQNPFLVLDTKFFTLEFKEKLLESISDLDEQTDGLLINSDNFHALNLLQEKYRERVKCVYIDPPYNTGSDGFLYKDSYQHSSWLSMMSDRLNSLYYLMNPMSIFFSSMDDEYTNLSLLLEKIFRGNNLSSLVWKKKKQPSFLSKVARVTEFIFAYAKDKNLIKKLSIDKISDETKRIDNSSNEITLREIPAGIFYKGNSNCIIKKGAYQNKTMSTEFLDDIVIKDGISQNSFKAKARFRNKQEDITLFANNKLLFITEKNSFRRLTSEEEKDKQKAITDLLLDWGDNQDSDNEKKCLFNNQAIFAYPKPTLLIYNLIKSTMLNEGIILDYFAGSGTTGHAVINLNREDDGNRKYILVEMAEYFDTVLKPRIQKIIYSEDWKDGKPVSRKGSSHIFKYMKLESYEDALNNLKSKDTAQIKLALEDANSSVNEKYMLSYILEFEYKDSILNVDMFSNPFDCRMNISNGTETKIVNIDLVETFNYLIGLNVRIIYVLNGFKIIEGYNRNEENVLVIWRNILEKSNDDLDKLFEKLRVNPRDYEFDKIFVNGDNNLENLKLDEESWKVTLIEEEFKKRMFDVQDV
ncbi:MAG: site-specific DNA-methyltransferase [bacterium]